MKPGVTLQEVQSEVDAIMAALSVEHPTTNEGIAMEFVPLREEATEEAAESTKLLFGADVGDQSREIGSAIGEVMEAFSSELGLRALTPLTHLPSRAKGRAA